MSILLFFEIRIQSAIQMKNYINENCKDKIRNELNGWALG